MQAKLKKTEEEFFRKQRAEAERLKAIADAEAAAKKKAKDDEKESSRTVVTVNR